MRKALTLVEAMILVAIVTIVLSVIGACCTSFHHEDKTIHVKSKGIVTNGKTSKYLVFCDDTTYEVEDSLIWWRFNSSDWYGQIKEGSTYHVTVTGYRLPFLSTYQNIVKMDEVK